MRGQTKRSGIFKNVFMHENRGLTRPQRAPGVSSTYGPLPPGALTDALWRPLWAARVYAPLPVCAACQRPWLCCVLSHVPRLLCALYYGTWHGPMAVACAYVCYPSHWLGCDSPLLWGVYRITPICRPCAPPEIRGYTRPRHIGVRLCGWPPRITHSAPCQAARGASGRTTT